MRPYEIVFTRLGRVLADRHYSVAAVETRVRKMVDDMVDEDDGPDVAGAFALLTIIMDDRPPDEQQCFVAIGTGRDELTVDSATFEESETLTEGPFKGKVVMMAVPGSMDRDDDEEFPGGQ